MNFLKLIQSAGYKTLTNWRLDSGSECGDGSHGICSIINNWQDADSGSPTNTYETLIKTSNDNSKYTECILGTIETCGSNSFGYNDNCSDGFLGGSSVFWKNLECFNAHSRITQLQMHKVVCNRHTCSTNTTSTSHIMEG